MSRSYKKTPIFGITGCVSEKQDKQIANRSFRRVVKQLINFDPLSYTYKDRRELKHNNVRDFGKDGKYYWDRKEFWYPELWDKHMRKK